MGSPRTGIGRCLGTFGELLQGALPIESREFLVTLPITEGSIAEFTAVPRSTGARFSSVQGEVTAIGGGVDATLQLEAGGELHIESELHEGKGCASSSADMVATARAIQSAFVSEFPGIPWPVS